MYDKTSTKCPSRAAAKANLSNEIEYERSSFILNFELTFRLWNKSHYQLQTKIMPQLREWWPMQSQEYDSPKSMKNKNERIVCFQVFNLPQPPHQTIVFHRRTLHSAKSDLWELSMLILSYQIWYIDKNVACSHHGNAKNNGQRQISVRNRELIKLIQISVSEKY